MKFILFVLILSLAGCRKDAPPPIDPYVLNGAGMGIYKNPETGEVKKLLPSQMKGYPAFEPAQLRAYVEWCFNPDGSK